MVESKPVCCADCHVQLLACALACVASPYDTTSAWERQNRTEPRDGVENTQDVNVNMAESFFAAAQRRLGLLSNSLIAVQCQYLAGLYEKFLLRPLNGWSLLQQASVQLQANLYAKGLAAASQRGLPCGKRARHIEQRLYWSCVKAEWYEY